MAHYDGLVLVAGASGGVGRRVVKYLVDQGIKTRVIVRDISKGEILAKLGVEVVQADVTDAATAPEKLAKAMEGVSAVISALGTRQMFSRTNGLKQVDYYGNRRLIDAARKAGIKHYILNSTMGVYAERSLFKPFSIPFYPKWQAENYLANSGLTYTIIRPGGLVDTDAALKGPQGWKRRAALAETSLSGEGGFDGTIGRVHRQDVAEVMVKSLWTPGTHNKIFDLLDYSSVKPALRAKVLKNIFA